jgi:hypothetical protein
MGRLMEWKVSSVHSVRRELSQAYHMLWIPLKAEWTYGDAAIIIGARICSNPNSNKDVSISPPLIFFELC